MLLFITTMKFVTPTSRSFFIRLNNVISFQPNIQILELKVRIRQKVGNLSCRVLSMKYRYLASKDPMKYEIFNVRGPMTIGVMVQTHNATGLLILELYDEFVNVNEGGRRLTTAPVNAKMEQEAESPTTWLCGEFMALLQSSHYETPESSMRRHSLVSTQDFNFGT